MPSRQLPKSNPTRFNAMRVAKERKDAVPAPPVNPFTPATVNWLDTFYPLYKAKIEEGEAALGLQGDITDDIKTARPAAEMFTLQFYEALQNAIKRGTFEKSIRPSYGLDLDDGNLPSIKSETDITYWGGKAASGEAARLLTPGAVPIPFPSIAEVDVAVNAFKNLNIQQANAKEVYNNAQEALAAMNPEADRLILKMWNEIETTYDVGDKPSTRRASREWGVVYVLTSGETPSPDDFSIMGKITAAGAATTPGVDEAKITVLETHTSVLSDENGDFFVPIQPPGNCTLQVEKPGFFSQTSNVQVVAGTITTVNISLMPVAAPPGP